MQRACASVENPVEKRVSGTRSHRFHGLSKTWKDIDAHALHVDFPVLSLDHLRNLKCGIYQLKQTSRYADENLTGVTMTYLQQNQIYTCTKPFPLCYYM